MEQGASPEGAEDSPAVLYITKYLTQKPSQIILVVNARLTPESPPPSPPLRAPRAARSRRRPPLHPRHHGALRLLHRRSRLGSSHPRPHRAGSLLAGRTPVDLARMAENLAGR